MQNIGEMTAQEIPDDIGIFDMVAIAAGTGHRGTPAALQLCVSPHISSNLLKNDKKAPPVRRNSVQTGGVSFLR